MRRGRHETMCIIWKYTQKFWRSHLCINKYPRVSLKMKGSWKRDQSNVVSALSSEDLCSVINMLPGLSCAHLMSKQLELWWIYSNFFKIKTSWCLKQQWNCRKSGSWGLGERWHHVNAVVGFEWFKLHCCTCPSAEALNKGFTLLLSWLSSSYSVFLLQYVFPFTIYFSLSQGGQV